MYSRHNDRHSHDVATGKTAAVIMQAHSHGRNVNWFVVSSIVCSVGTEKMGCNKRQSVQLLFILTTLSYTKINTDSAGTRKVCINGASVIAESVIMKF